MRKQLLIRSLLAGLALPIILGLSGLGAGPASAHTALVGSDPANGSTLPTAPARIALDFNENIGSEPQVAVIAPDGTPVKVSNIQAIDQQVTADVADVGQRGTYSLSYRVVSADGHPVMATVKYEVTTGSTVKQVDTPKSEGFIHRHRSHLFWGILAAAIAIGLLLAPLRKRHDPDNA